MYDLQRDILKPVVKRIKSRKDSLVELRRFASNLGFEGWLKVETIAVLGKKLRWARNTKADLLFEGGLEIELKGANDLNLSGLRNAALTYKTPCLFIGDGSREEKVEKLATEEIDIIGYEIFSDGKNKWVVGMIAPVNFKVSNNNK
jgi:hypothetical protein